MIGLAAALSTITVLLNVIEAESIKGPKTYLELQSQEDFAVQYRGHSRSSKSDDDDGPAYNKILEVTNLAYQQPFGPFFVMSHTDDVPPLYRLGQPATEALAILAETGDPGPLVEFYSEQDGVFYAGAVTEGAPFFVGGSFNLTIPFAEGYDRFTIASMAINTNDCFVALSSRPLIRENRNIQVPGLDSGSEENNEDCESIPGPACPVDSGNERSGDGEGVVHVHRGVFGIGDLTKSVYDWRNPMMMVAADTAPCDIGQVLAQVISDIVVESDPSYDDARYQWGSFMATSDISDRRTSPKAIAYCNSDEDVIAVINAARMCNYKVSVRSGGHEYTALSSCEEESNCVQIDMSGFKTIDHVEGTPIITLGAGLIIEEVIEYIGSIANPGPLVIPMGICNKVGIGGNFASSAVGYLARELGLGLDFVTSFRIATADGSILTVTPESHPDLYWAALGGAPGSFGVVLDYTINAIPSFSYLNANVFTFIWEYDHETFVGIVNKVIEISSQEETAKDLFLSVGIGLLDEIASDPILAELPFLPTYIRLNGVWSGSTLGRLTLGSENYNKYVQPFLDIGGPPFQSVPPVHQDFVPLHVTQEGLRVDFIFAGDWRFHIHNMMMRDWIDTDFIEGLANEIDDRITVPFLRFDIQLSPLGGDGSQFTQNAGLNAYPNRDVKLNVDDFLIFKEEDDEAVRYRVENYRKQTRDYWMHPGLGNERSFWSMDTFIADESSMEDDWKEFYPSRDWYGRLRSVKLDVDPCNVFSHSMTIPLEDNEISRYCDE